MTFQLENSGEAARISQLAREVFTRDLLVDRNTRKRARILQALPIFNTKQEFHSWFVPVILSDRLIGFFQYLSDGKYMRFSIFQHHPEDIENCPMVMHWLDLNYIIAQAKRFRQKDETNGKPFLSFDKVPDRIVWAVPLISSSGNERYVFVVGKNVYLPTSDNGIA